MIKLIVGMALGSLLTVLGIGIFGEEDTEE